MAQQTTPQTAETERIGPSDTSWLTAKEIMDATGIAKDDLIRFIQLNVLPKSMMRIVPGGPRAVRRKSYFSSTLLGHVAMLKMLRDEGHAVETIARELGPAEGRRLAARNPQPPIETPAAMPEAGKSADPMPLVFPLPAGAVTGSAFFVNADMRIGWVKVAQDDFLFDTIRDEMNDDPSGTVFDILLRASLKELVFNWQPLFSFIYRFLEDITPSETFTRVAPMVSFHLEGLDQPAHSGAYAPKARPRIDSTAIRLEDGKGRMRSMRLYAIALSDGALFIFQEERWQDPHGDMRLRREGGDGRAAAEPADDKTPFSVISARLDNARRLVDTLLPETYYRLITRIWNATDRIVQSYGGQRSKRNGTAVQYIIPRQAGTDPAFDAIRCAAQLRQAVREIEDALKAEGRWVARICLNIGISSGKDHLPEEDLTASVAFMLPGGAADQADHLSALASGGSMLITKSAFSHLSPRQMDGITFGIYRDDRLIPKIFAQVSELPHAADAPPIPQEIQALFVTCIVDIAPHHHRRQA